MQVAVSVRAHPHPIPDRTNNTYWLYLCKITSKIRKKPFPKRTPSIKPKTTNSLCACRSGRVPDLPRFAAVFQFQQFGPAAGQPQLGLSSYASCLLQEGICTSMNIPGCNTVIQRRVRFKVVPACLHLCSGSVSPLNFNRKISKTVHLFCPFLDGLM